MGAGYGPRTVFRIACCSGARIKNFSDFGADFEYYLQPVGAAGQNEDEILLPCGTSFVIDGIEKCPNDVTEVTMHQVEDHNAGVDLSAGSADHDDGDDDGEGQVGNAEKQRLKVRRQSMSIAAQIEATFVVKLPQKTSGTKMIVVCSAPASDPTLGKIEIYNQKGKSSTSMPLKTIRLKNVVAVKKMSAKKQPDFVVVEDSANPNNPFTFAPASNSAESTALIDELFQFIQDPMAPISI